MKRWCDPAAWEARWWLPLAGLVMAAGLLLDRPERGPPPRADAAAMEPALAPPPCADLEDGYARAACNAG